MDKTGWKCPICEKGFFVYLGDDKTGDYYVCDTCGRVEKG